MLRTQRKPIGSGKRVGITLVVLGVFSASLFAALRVPVAGSSPTAALQVPVAGSSPTQVIMTHRVIVVHEHINKGSAQSAPAPDATSNNLKQVLGTVSAGLLVAAALIGGSFLICHRYHPRLGWIPRSFR